MHLVSESKGTMNLFTYITTQKATYPSIAWYEINQKLQAMDVKPEGYRDFSSGEALRSWYRREKNKRGNDIPNVFNDADEPINHFPNVVALPKPFDAPLTIPLQQILVIADIHAGYPDMDYLNGVIEHALDEVYQLDAIIIAGDVFDFDGISRHPKDHNVARLESELEIAAQILLKLADIAPVYVCSGNHCERLAVKLDTKFGLTRIISAALNGRSAKHDIIATDYDYIDVGKLFRVGHLSSYSRIPGKIAHTIAQRIKRTVLSGHDHLAGVFSGGNDQYVGASIGCIADHDKFWYANRRMNDMPPFQKGYAIIDPTGSFSLFDADFNMYFARMYFGELWYNCFSVK